MEKSQDPFPQLRVTRRTAIAAYMLTEAHLKKVIREFFEIKTNPKGGLCKCRICKEKVKREQPAFKCESCEWLVHTKCIREPELRAYERREFVQKDFHQVASRVRKDYEDISATETEKSETILESSMLDETTKFKEVPFNCYKCVQFTALPLPYKMQASKASSYLEALPTDFVDMRKLEDQGLSSAEFQKRLAEPQFLPIRKDRSLLAEIVAGKYDRMFPHGARAFHVKGKLASARDKKMESKFAEYYRY